MIDILEYGFMQRALIAGMMIAVICSTIGLFLVLRRMSMLGDGLAHISFGGIAAGMFFGFYPVLSALIFSVLSALGIQKLRSMKVYGDAAIAIFFSFGLALGVVLVSMSNGFNSDLFSYLFGSILAVGVTDLIIIAGLGIGTMLILAIFYKELFFIAFDEECAKASGINVENINSVLVVLAAVAVVLSMKVVGILLVSSFMVIPASTALLLRSGFRNSIFLSIGIAVFSVIAGLTLSFYADIAAGGAVVTVLVSIFAMVLLYKKLGSK
ncbi:metal ABC transporter permease [Candidatus Micrarchaeota archaeon]|nr:metal ABC transporter permease [Candidatus Micrarchaeota archaeon]